MAEMVFYSWQSDLPNSINRGFIQDCLERAIKDLRAEEDLLLDFDIDRDTLDRTGSPDIVQSIFEKIDNCRIFVCDVSIINQGSTGRPCPNPNVLTELGWAAAKKGWDAVICVFNMNTSNLQSLPFDLRSRRVVTYSLVKDEDKASVRKELVSKLSASIKDIAHGNLPKLGKALVSLFRAINPVILTYLQRGYRRFSINISVKNELIMQEMLRSPRIGELICVNPNGNFLSNNTNSTGGINDIGPGTLNGYNIEVGETLIQFLA